MGDEETGHRGPEDPAAHLLGRPQPVRRPEPVYAEVDRGHKLGWALDQERAKQVGECAAWGV